MTWLRMFLSVGLEDAISYEKQINFYELEEDGLVKVRFTDGSVARGQLLVGAYGLKSRVRQQFQLERKLLDLERCAMWGRTVLTNE